MSNIDLGLFSYIQRLPVSTPQGAYPYSFVSRKSKKLVVTVGDSWTWGADITPTDDNLLRLEKSYGGIISRELSADYLNLGQCGSCNLHIIERIKELNSISFDYDKVYVVCTFTEAGRSLNGPYDKNINYVDWFKSNQVTDLLEFHNSIGLDHLKELSNKATVITGCNFVDPLGFEPTLATTWVELYNQQTTQYEYQKPCYVVSSWVIDKLRPFVEEFRSDIDATELIGWISELIDLAISRKRLMADRQYYNNLNHPTAYGHKIWADYILENLND